MFKPQILKGGAKPAHHKNTAGLETEKLPIPGRVCFPMSQHIGAPCTPVVEKGDKVRVGTLIGEKVGYMCAPIYSSVSGEVVEVGEILQPNGTKISAVIIETDGEQLLDESIAPPEVTDYESFIAAIEKSGLVGLGGAGLPTFVKLSPPDKDKVDTLIINGAECEPYITADDREFRENSENVAKGIELVKKYLDIKNVVIGIESNKPESIKIMRDLGYEVHALPSKYPQGAEKVLVYQITGETVPEGGLPLDVGIIVMNVSTVAFVAEYLSNGIPLIHRRVTVDGDAIATPKNVMVPIGTYLSDIIAFCGGYKKDVKKLILGGPMMGTALYSDDYPLTRPNNAILAFSVDVAKEERELNCMRCSRCIYACPIGLNPVSTENALLQNDMDRLEKLKPNLCMECGCCSFACPSKRYVTQTMRLAKQAVAQK